MGRSGSLLFLHLLVAISATEATQSQIRRSANTDLSNGIGLDSHAVAGDINLLKENKLIPYRLLMNYATNLLGNGTEKPHLRANIQNTIKLHPGADVLFYDNDACREALQRVHSEELAERFQRESCGPFKSDMCRLAMLYESGGYYTDNDMEIAGNMHEMVPAGTSLSTAIDLRGDVFQSFLAAAPRHYGIMTALNNTLEAYNNHQRGSCNSHMGPRVLTTTLKALLKVDSFQVGPAIVPGTKDSFYIYKETRDLEGYGVTPRTNFVSGFNVCNIVVADEHTVLAWSRILGVKTCFSKDDPVRPD